MVKNKYSIVLGVLFLMSFLIRFLGLGYSSFYGDETKVFYLDKTIPAFQFFMDQRKGPIQFLVVWIMEKLVGVPHELYSRVPFALAGFLSVIIFYLLAKKLFNEKVALVSTIFFAFNGFNVAFSRTIQYQSFLILFGLSGLYLFINKKYFYSALSLGLALLSHYDAVFFLVPLLYFAWDQKIDFKKLMISFFAPLLIIAGLFYVPYIYQGYFSSNTLTYLSKRLGGGTNNAKNYSMLTFIFYNFCITTLVFLFSPILLFFKKLDLNKHSETVLKMLGFWFVVSFLFYQLFISNPGTHIHNYFLPIYFLAGYTVVTLYESISKKGHRKIYFGVVCVMAFLMILKMSVTYVPQFNYGYPWKLSFYRNIDDKYQLFVYGFPYNRNWKEISRYFNSLDERVGGVFTNDDDDVAMFYLRGFNYTRPGTNFLPQYYIDIKDNMEFSRYKSFEFTPGIKMTEEEFYSNYAEVHRVSKDVVIYKRLDFDLSKILGLRF